jgi:hypothetical protein
VTYERQNLTQSRKDAKRIQTNCIAAKDHKDRKNSHKKVLSGGTPTKYVKATNQHGKSYVDIIQALDTQFAPKCASLGYYPFPLCALRSFAAIQYLALLFAAWRLCVRFRLSVSGEASHEANQALDLFLGEIGVRRHGAGFADGDASTLDHGPDPVVQGSSLPIRVRQILWFLS